MTNRATRRLDGRLIYCLNDTVETDFWAALRRQLPVDMPRSNRLALFPIGVEDTFLVTEPKDLVITIHK